MKMVNFLIFSNYFIIFIRIIHRYYNKMSKVPHYYVRINYYN